MNAEINRQLDSHRTEIVARVMWTLYDIFGFGPKRLKQFYDEFDKSIDDLIDKYEMVDSDDAWLCQYKLKQIGVDLDKWKKEK